MTDFDTTTFIVNPENYYKEARTEFLLEYRANERRYQDASKAIRILISQILKSEGIPFSKIISRVKDRDECIQKFDRKYRDECEKKSAKYSISNHISDLIGIRVVCFYEDDVTVVRDAINTHLRILDETDKMTAENPNEFGYKGLHLDIALDDRRGEIIEYAEFKQLSFEVQIRTIVQDAWSEIDHKLQYKREIPLALKRRINSLAALFETADTSFKSVRDETRKLFEEKKENEKSPTPDEPLDAINFSAIVDPLFPDFTFHHERNDFFVSEVKESDREITRDQFKNAVIENIENVRNYRKYLIETAGNKGVNPITVIRYCLYLSNKVLFEDLVFPGLRQSIERWLEYGTVYPSEIGKSREPDSA